MSPECVVGIDVGTTSTRVIIYTIDGQLLAEGCASHRVSYPHAGWAEENAEDWWHAVAIKGQPCIGLVRNHIDTSAQFGLHTSDASQSYS